MCVPDRQENSFSLYGHPFVLTEVEDRVADARVNDHVRPFGEPTGSHSNAAFISPSGCSSGTVRRLATTVATCQADVPGQMPEPSWFYMMLHLVE